MLLLTGSHDPRHYVCGAQAAANWVEGKSVSFCVFRSPNGVQRHYLHPPVVGTHSHRSTTADDSSHLTILR